MQVFLAFADAKCQVPEGRQTAAAAAWLHQGYFAGEPDSNAIGLDSLGLQATGRLQKNYQEALAQFAAHKCESPYTQNVFASLVELINKRRAATPNGTPAPNEPPPFRQVLDRLSFDKLKEALESWQKRGSSLYAQAAMRDKAYLIDLYQQRCDGGRNVYFCGILARLETVMHDIPKIDLPPAPQPRPLPPNSLPPPAKRRVQAPDAPFTLGSELFVSLDEPLDLRDLAGERRVRAQVVRFVGMARNGGKPVGSEATIRVFRPEKAVQAGMAIVRLVMESIEMDGRSVPLTTRPVQRPVPGPGSRYKGRGVLPAGTRLIFVIEP